MKAGKKKTVRKTARRTVAVAAAAQTTPAKDKLFTRVLTTLRIIYRLPDGNVRIRIFHPLTLPVFGVYLPAMFAVSILRMAVHELKMQFNFVVKIMRPFSNDALTDLVALALFVCAVGALVRFFIG